MFSKTDILFQMFYLLFFTSLASSVLGSSSPSSWASWSSWSSCSRSCGGGLEWRQRMCLSSGGCDGAGKVWRVCQLHPCPDPSIDWLDEQCARFNNQPVEGRYHLWSSHRNWDNPCSLHCRASDEPQLVVNMADRMEEGTSCSNSSLKVCLQGTCEVNCFLGSVFIT